MFTNKWIKLLLVVLVISMLPVAIAAAAGRQNMDRANTVLVRGQSYAPNYAPKPEGNGAVILPDRNPLRLPETVKATPPLPNMPVVWKEGFEYAWPNATWVTFDNNGGWDMCWDDVNKRDFKGSWSGWPGDGCADGWSPYNGYDADMDSWMVLGPVSTSGAKKGTLKFKYWLDTEYGYDYLHYCASADGSNFYCSATSGWSANKWKSGTLNLANVPGWGNMLGYSQVWIAFVFTSDINVQYEGVYIDEINLTVK